MSAPVAVRVSGEPAAVGSFAVPSATFPGETWTVLYQGADLMHCFCPAFAHRGVCRHTQAVALALEVEARTQATPERRAEAARRLNAIEREFA